MSVSPEFSVIIAAFTEKRWSDLVDAVASVKLQRLPAKEIIVAVDHNRLLFDRAAAEIKAATVVASGFAKGASGARNSGVAASTGSILAFLDDDAVADPDWLENLNDVYMDDNICAVGGRIDPLWLSGRPYWFPQEFNWVVGASYTGGPTKMQAVRNLWTVNLSVRRSAFEKVGGFRPDFGKVGSRSRPEDTDLCLRIARAWSGKAIIYTPKARVVHKVSADRASFSYFATRCYREGVGKAELAQHLPQDTVLSVERHYVRHVLPAGVAAGCWEAVSRGRFDGLARAAAIVSGIGCAAAGYALGALRATLSKPAVRPCSISTGGQDTPGRTPP